MSASAVERFSSEIEATGVVAILRGLPRGAALGVAGALADAGVTLIEIALSAPDAVAELSHLHREFRGDAMIGAGTVTSALLAEQAAEAGATFLVTPHVVDEVNAYGRRHAIPVLGGAMTPTEVAAARLAGNHYVKIFPAGVVGPAFFAAMRGPYPDARLVAVGGVGPENAAAFVRAGAVAVGVGGALTRAGDDRAATSAAAAALLAAVRAGKEGVR